MNISLSSACISQVLFPVMVPEPQITERRGRFPAPHLMTQSELFLAAGAAGQDLRNISVLALAHLGDGVYELLVRSHLLCAGLATTAQLHQRTTELVCAPAQSDAAELILPLLTEEEAAIYRRGRNADVHNIPKNASHAQYSRATGLEALFGALFLTGKNYRIRQLFDCIIKSDGNKSIGK